MFSKKTPSKNAHISRSRRNLRDGPFALLFNVRFKDHFQLLQRAKHAVAQRKHPSQVLVLLVAQQRLELGLKELQMLADQHLVQRLSERLLSGVIEIELTSVAFFANSIFDLEKYANNEYLFSCSVNRHFLENLLFTDSTTYILCPTRLRSKYFAKKAIF